MQFIKLWVVTHTWRGTDYTEKLFTDREEVKEYLAEQLEENGFELDKEVLDELTLEGFLKRYWAYEDEMRETHGDDWMMDGCPLDMHCNSYEIKLDTSLTIEQQ